METFSAVEELSPDLVLISQAMTRFREFTVMKGLFETLGIRWVELEETRAAPRDAQTHRSGLFALSTAMPPRDLRNAVLSLLNPAVRQARQSKGATAPNARADTSRLVLIGSSTGGVDALVRVLGGFPRNCPATVIVQHTGAGFGQSLTGLLDRNCAAQVRMAADGAPVTPGTVTLAAGLRRQVGLVQNDGLRIRLGDDIPVSGHLPSVDHLFQSAVPFGHRVHAALLTGMGSDGARGMVQLRDAGARTIGQDKESCVVYGMPRVAMEMGGVGRQLPLGQIADALLTG